MTGSQSILVFALMTDCVLSRSPRPPEAAEVMLVVEVLPVSSMPIV
ncbi:MAG: hypothetical protein ACLR8J_05385 [Sutterella wadsworthensis]